MRILLRLAHALSALAVLLGLSSGALAATALVDDARVRAPGAGAEWLVSGGNFSQQHHSPLTTLNQGNVGRLGLGWAIDIDSPMGLSSEPLVVDGTIYLTAPQAVVYAIDAASGRVRWIFRPTLHLDQSVDGSYSARTNRGVAVWKGLVYVGTPDCRLVAIDAASGAARWESRVCDARLTGITGAPRVGHDRVYLGYVGADEQIRGSIAAFDAQTGRELWRFWTVPGDPAKGFESKALEAAARTWSGREWWHQGGGTVWDPITYDPTTDLVLFGTSKSFGDEGEGAGGQRTATGSKLYSGSIVAVHGATGEYAWHLQTSRPERQNENFHIALADLRIDGVQRHVAMTVPREGTLHVMDARTGELLYRAPLVEQGPVPGAGTRVLPYAGVTYRGVEDCPQGGCFGARNWWPMSFSPATGLLYVPLIDRRPSGYRDGPLPLIGRLAAWDVAARKLRWTVNHPIAVNSGVLSTAGGLVFQGEGTGEIAAYAAATGQKLWSAETGSAINATPVTYALNGEQYLLVPVGWGSAFRLFAQANLFVTETSKYGPSRLLAFRLGGTLPLPAPVRSRPAVPEPPPQTYTAEAVHRGEQKAEEAGCTGCHSPNLDGAGRFIEQGGVPDLRYLPREVHAAWYAIVLGGSHRDRGMLGFANATPGQPSALTPKDADDIHAYVIDRAWARYRAQTATH